MIDGTVHDLARDIPRRPGTPGQYRSAHTRWHKQRDVFSPTCEFCRKDADDLALKLRPPQIPLPISKPNPVPLDPPKVEQAEVEVVIEVLNNLPLPIQADSDSEQPETTMQAAFNRLNRKS